MRSALSSDLLRVEVPDPEAWRASTDYSVALTSDNKDLTSLRFGSARHDSEAGFLGSNSRSQGLAGIPPFPEGP